ncbi:MAG: DUF3108 domain-containing protein [Oleiphilus sp.]
MIVKIKAYLGLFVFLCFSSVVSSIELQQHEATYTAKIKKGVSIDGSATRSLKKLDDSRWLYRFDVESFIADIKEKSVLSFENGRVVPEEYNYKLSAFLMSDRKRNIKFNWQNKIAENPLKKGWRLNGIPENTYDRLSYQLQLLLDVNQGKETIKYQIAHKGKLRESQFVILGEEVLETKFGKLNSIVAKKQRDEDAKRETYLWFSSDYPLLLLRMTQKEKDGEEYEIILSSAEINGEKIDLSKNAVTSTAQGEI